MKMRMMSVICVLCLLAATGCFKMPSKTPKLPTVPPPPSAVAGSNSVANAPQQAVSSNTPTITTFIPSIQRQVPPAPEPSDTGNLDAYAAAVDLCGKDLSQSDLSASKDMLERAFFDSNTTWPAKLPEDFNPYSWMQNGLNPGLGIADLQRQGNTGEGVNIAMIGEPILTTHQELKESLVDYEEFGSVPLYADSHATAAASILVGKSCGIAPDTKLYYFAASMAKTQDDFDNNIYDYSAYKQALDRIYQINQLMSEADKIKLVVIDGFIIEPDQIVNGKPITLTGGNDAVKMSAAVLENTGVCVMDYLNTSAHVGLYAVLGPYSLSRNPMADVDDLCSYKQASTVTTATQEPTLNIYVPTEHRTLASAYGNNKYVHYAAAPCVLDLMGISTQGHPGDFKYDGFASAYLAGLYALGLTKNPGLTEFDFLRAADDTFLLVMKDFNSKDVQVFACRPGDTNPKRLGMYKTSVWLADGGENGSRLDDSVSDELGGYTFNIIQPAALLAELTN